VRFRPLYDAIDSQKQAFIVSSFKNDRDLPATRQKEVLIQTAKKKGCKQKKCSNWKGGKCQCGRE
jgi:hypothetical protein